MDLKRLRTFVAVADLGTVSKAALRLRISQSALSRQISDLEYECGFKLFDRIGRRRTSARRSPLGRGGRIDFVALAAHPLLLLDPGYSVRRLFDAACRVADVEPDILVRAVRRTRCSRSPKPGRASRSFRPCCAPIATG